MYRTRHRLILISAAILALIIMVLCAVELRVKPIVLEFASSRARQFSSEVINTAVSSLLSDSAPLVKISTSDTGVASAEVNAHAVSTLRKAAVDAVSEKLRSTRTLKLNVPIFNLTGSALASGVGVPISVKLLPIGDIVADIRTEFVESGINQTLHRIVLRIRLTLSLLVANEAIGEDITSDIVLAETVIVGGVPDAYTAINRFEIDEQEENDLNDYAATIP